MEDAERMKAIQLIYNRSRLPTAYLLQTCPVDQHYSELTKVT